MDVDPLLPPPPSSSSRHQDEDEVDVAIVLPIVHDDDDDDDEEEEEGEDTLSVRDPPEFDHEDEEDEEDEEKEEEESGGLCRLHREPRYRYASTWVAVLALGEELGTRALSLSRARGGKKTKKTEDNNKDEDDDEVEVEEVGVDRVWEEMRERIERRRRFYRRTARVFVSNGTSIQRVWKLLDKRSASFMLVEAVLTVKESGFDIDCLIRETRIPEGTEVLSERYPSKICFEASFTQTQLDWTWSEARKAIVRNCSALEGILTTTFKKGMDAFGLSSYQMRSFFAFFACRSTAPSTLEMLRSDWDLENVTNDLLKSAPRKAKKPLSKPKYREPKVILPKKNSGSTSGSSVQTSTSTTPAASVPRSSGKSKGGKDGAKQKKGREPKEKAVSKVVDLVEDENEPCTFVMEMCDWSPESRDIFCEPYPYPLVLGSSHHFDLTEDGFYEYSQVMDEFLTSNGINLIPSSRGRAASISTISALSPSSFVLESDMENSGVVDSIASSGTRAGGDDVVCAPPPILDPASSLLDLCVNESSNLSPEQRILLLSGHLISRAKMKRKEFNLALDLCEELQCQVLLSPLLGVDDKALISSEEAAPRTEEKITENSNFASPQVPSSDSMSPTLSSNEVKSEKGVGSDSTTPSLSLPKRWRPSRPLLDSSKSFLEQGGPYSQVLELSSRRVRPQSQDDLSLPDMSTHFFSLSRLDCDELCSELIFHSLIVTLGNLREVSAKSTTVDGRALGDVFSTITDKIYRKPVSNPSDEAL